MLAVECAGQRAIVGLGYNSFPDPLPKLRLGGPELFPIAANHQRRFLLSLLFLVLVCAHYF